VLIEIRDEVRKTNQRLDETNERMTEGLDRLERRQVETEVRLSTGLVEVIGALQEVRDAVLDERRLFEQVSDHERRIAALETGHAGG
jgi:hypothetical protein